MTDAVASVILLHGLARTHRSMQHLADRLAEHGYQVINLGYDSRQREISALATQAIEPALEQCQPGKPVHFVTHSLGGILVRHFLARKPIDRLGRVVMLGPPNHGSEVVDRLRDVPGFRFINGEAGLELGTGRSSVPNRLGKADFDVGIIAGTRSVNLILSTLIPGRNDGKVSVDSTRLEGMRDHLEMAVTHPFMMRNDRVIEQVLYYLEQGRFDRQR